MLDKYLLISWLTDSEQHKGIGAWKDRKLRGREGERERQRERGEREEGEKGREWEREGKKERKRKKEGGRRGRRREHLKRQGPRRLHTFPQDFCGFRSHLSDHILSYIER